MAVPAVVAVLVACWICARRLSNGAGRNQVALAALIAALVPVAGFVLAVIAVRRVPHHGGKAWALTALGVSGVVTSVAAAQIAACVVSDGCFH